MAWMLYAALILLLPTRNCQEQYGCGSSEFSFQYNGNCSQTCPGRCNGQICCVEQCFDANSDGRTISSQCMNQDNVATCSVFREEMECVVELFNSTFEICLQQIWILYSTNTLVGDFHPRYCPCENGYVRISDKDLALIPLCQQDGMCYNVTDDVTNTTATCLSPELVPTESVCHDDERLYDIVVLLTMDECAANCDGTCREGGEGKLPACCKHHTTHAPGPPEDGGSEVMHVGFIILIVVVIIVLFVVMLFGYLYIKRYRTLVKQRTRENFTDLAADMKTNDNYTDLTADMNTSTM